MMAVCSRSPLGVDPLAAHFFRFAVTSGLAAATALPLTFDRSRIALIIRHS